SSRRGARALRGRSVRTTGPRGARGGPGDLSSRRTGMLHGCQYPRLPISRTYATASYETLPENDNEGQATNKIRHWKLPSSIEEPPLKIRTWGAVERVGCEAGELRGGHTMMRLRRASVIAALSLHASAATASADCAWVFWFNPGRSSKTISLCSPQ